MMFLKFLVFVFYPFTNVRFGTASPQFYSFFNGQSNDTSKSINGGNFNPFNALNFFGTAADILCESTNTKAMGFCTTSHSCKKAKGVADGSCGDSILGICCVVNVQGSTTETTVVTQQVVTLFSDGTEGTVPKRKPKAMTNSKRVFLFPKQAGICQLKVNFLDTALKNPETDISNAGNCVQDAVTFDGSITPLAGSITVCGNLADQHMYLTYGRYELGADFDDDITITIKTSDAAAKYAINVIRLRCDSDQIVSDYCLQRFTTDTGMVKSFGYPYQLNNQHYTICTRGATAGVKSITWSECPGTGMTKPFFVTGSLDAMGNPPPSEAGRTMCATDYIEHILLNPPGRHCGGSFPKVTVSGPRGHLTVRFDGDEVGHSAIVMDLPPSVTSCAETSIIFPGHTCTHPPNSPTKCICTLKPEFPIEVKMPVLATEFCPTVSGYVCTKSTATECGCVQQYKEADVGNTGFCLQFTHNY